MRSLTFSARAFAAESLGIAYSHESSAISLLNSGEYAASITPLYYAAFHTTKAAMADLGRRSKKHQYWQTQLNKRHGRRESWLPKQYVKTVNQLFELRSDRDYDDAVPNDEKPARKYFRQVNMYLKKVTSNTPLVFYPEFIEMLAKRNPDLLALEFDYYCPKSYLHKERMQLQLKLETFTVSTTKKVAKCGRYITRTVKANRCKDYVTGWNNRFGQSGEYYILFLDIDCNDSGKVRKALSKRSGCVFKSGRGFHFVSNIRIKGRKQWESRLKKASQSKALKGLVDHKHVEFSLRRGYSTLRISKSPIKEFLPFLAWKL